MNETVRVTYGQANLMIYQADWTALLTTLSWREVENADRYTITLTDQARKSALVSVDMSGGQPKITVSGQTPAAESGGWYNVKPGSTVTGQRFPVSPRSVHVPKPTSGMRTPLTAHQP